MDYSTMQRVSVQYQYEHYLICSIFICVAELIATIGFLLILYWGYAFGGGFGWRDAPAQEFRLHPVLMSFGLLFCQGSSIMIYRLLRFLEKKILKSLHVVFHTITIICMIFGFITAYDSHVLAKPPKPDFMSLHSWIGLSTLSLFLIQFIISFVCYMKPGLPRKFRIFMMPFHRNLGVIIFVLSYATVMMGMSEKAAWSMTCWTVEGYFCREMVIMNLFGVATTLYVIIVIVVVTNQKWIRKELYFQ